jgi:hypothetical protein
MLIMAHVQYPCQLSLPVIHASELAVSHLDVDYRCSASILDSDTQFFKYTIRENLHHTV